MKEKKIPDSRQARQYRTLGTMGIIVVLLLVCALLGNQRINREIEISIEESSNIERASVEESQAEVWQSIEESKMEETAVHEIFLSKNEGELLSHLTEKLEVGDLAAAAGILNNNEEAFQKLFFEKIGDKTCLYDGTVMVDKAEGHGLVFRRAATVFYGDFSDGKPEGECLAIQAIRLDEGVRYDYSTGIWESGEMNGPGECGYKYYEGILGDGAKQIVKKGDFSQNLMEGQITYTSLNSDEEETSWSMEIKEGVMLPDERWIPDTDENGAAIYRRIADTDEVHAYVITEDDMSEVRWKNMIEWDG